MLWTLVPFGYAFLIWVPSLQYYNIGPIFGRNSYMSILTVNAFYPSFDTPNAPLFIPLLLPSWSPSILSSPQLKLGWKFFTKWVFWSTNLRLKGSQLSNWSIDDFCPEWGNFRVCLIKSWKMNTRPWLHLFLIFYGFFFLPHRPKYFVPWKTQLIEHFTKSFSFFKFL